MDEIGYLIESADDKQPESTTAKIRIIIEGDYEFDTYSYREVIDEDGNDIALDEEQRDALTPAEMLEYDRRFLKHGDIGLDDILGVIDIDRDNIKLEIAE